MPSVEAMNAMSQSIAGVDWEKITNYEWRIKIMSLAIAHEHNEILDVIEGHLSVTNEHLKAIADQLDTLTDHTDEMGRWFSKSKLWEGEAYVTGR